MLRTFAISSGLSLDPPHCAMAHDIGMSPPELETIQNRRMLSILFRVWSEDEACLKVASDELQLVFRHQTLNVPGADKLVGEMDEYER